jgi:DHA2 family multidrug resistance protein
MNAPIITEKNPYRYFIVIAIMLSTVMEILDTTIVNVSLPHMMGSLSADRDEISWVLTSYIVAAGILMPLTGFLVNRLGSKRLLLINIIGFMVASALCGVSTSLSEIVIFRIFQGLFGASLVPLSQFILRDSFPAEEQPKMMAIWGIGVMSAPIMGPTLGGFITDSLNWRWIFYINVPICILNIFLVVTFLKESTVRKDTIDWIGMVLLICSIGALQLFLDRGQVDDWFSSPVICWLFIIFIITFILFLIHSWQTENTIINLRLFRNKNFVLGTLAMTFFAAAVLGSLTLLPQMLESLFGYSSELAGITMAPRGIASAIMMAIGSQMLSRGVDARRIISFGLAVGVVTTWVMSMLTLDTNFGFIIVLGFIQGFGIGAFFMPLTTIVYTNLPKKALAEATGLFSFGRNIGNAMGISLLVTYLSRDTQQNWHLLGSHINPANPNLVHWLKVQHLKLGDPHALARLGQTLVKQADFLAYTNTYRIAALILLVAFILSLLLKPPPAKPVGIHSNSVFNEV